MIYEKYRPFQFNQVIGQEKIISVLKAQSKMGEFAHSYMFFGQSGSGKTSVARIMAMAMNCSQINDGTGEPCGECESCRAIRRSKHWDVLELDSGRFRGIDDVRNLCYKAYFSPMASRKKVYILDECQQLTSEAWGSLLKLLEEPPPHLCIILCTTNGLGDGKIPETVVSRCQLYPLMKLKVDGVKTKLKFIAQGEGIEFDDGWLNWVANFAQGNLRIAECELEKHITLVRANNGHK